MDQKEFKKEQAHLTAVYEKLLAMEKSLTERIRTLDATALDDKNDMRDNMRFDYADDETTMETLAELEVWNRYIDTYNVESDSLGRDLRAVRKLLEAPYFAEIRLQFDPAEEPESYYIGRAGIMENGREPMIIDWRSPIAEVYYNQESGPTHYAVEDREIAVDLKLRRQFDLQKDRLISYFDTGIAIEDPMLLKSLSQTHSDKMQAITSTIQKEQNTVIRYPDVPMLLVDGIAGSGKTSVLLQRIAYLFYRKRKDLRPDQVCLMTLNPIFRDYIDEVLPDLGETNPLTITWQEFLAMLRVPVTKEEHENDAADRLQRIRDGLPMLTPEPGDFFDIMQKDRLVMSAKEVFGVVREFRQFPYGTRLIQIATDELEERAKNRLRHMAGDSDAASDVGGKTDDSEDRRLENDYGGAIQNIRKYAWINVRHVAQRILGTRQITEAEWLCTMLELTGACDRNMRYVMIDEVQDYTKAQLEILRKYYPNARFMLLGDEFQSVREGTVSFSEIEEMTRADKKQFVSLPLTTSYRSSPEITELFAALLPEEKKLMVSSVRRPGEPISIRVCKTEREYDRELKKLITQYEKEDGLTAVICRNAYQLERLATTLGKDAPAVIEGQDTLPKQGAFLIELTLAKGLEFDQVILPDVDPENYPNDRLGRHCLYTAISRATACLSILARGEASELLRSCENISRNDERS
ncbi:MAG: UvrD-helicase domain-containing protein [Lachnospiraceae bacterium]|nr:UvrD-helicase domain-containing protein [Lachnospiraceae bacterium]